MGWDVWVMERRYLFGFKYADLVYLVILVFKYELGTHEVILDSTVPSVTAPNATFLT